MGNAISETRLPALLAEYSQYGSETPLRAIENQRCASGAVDASTTNGSPMRVVSVHSSHEIGWCAAEAPSPLTVNGNTSSGSHTMTAWTIACRRTPSHCNPTWLYAYPARSAA